MTQQVLDDLAVLARQSLLSNVAVLEALTAYALKRQDKAPSMYGLSATQQDFLDSEAGRTETARLLLAFRESVSLLSIYRDQLAHGPAPPLDDLAEAREASERPLGALRRRLAHLVPAS